MPEIADLCAPARDLTEVGEIRKAAAGRPIVSLLGNLHPRKGIFTFLETARRAWGSGTPLFFVAAGDLSVSSSGGAHEEIASLASTAPPNFRLIGRRLFDGPEFNAYVAMSDLLFCAYWNFPFNSNLLTKAAFFSKPVLVSEGHLMETLTRAYGLGLAIPQQNPDATLRAMDELLLNSFSAHRNLCPRYADYVRANGVENLDSAINSFLDQSQSH